MSEALMLMVEKADALRERQEAIQRAALKALVTAVIDLCRDQRDSKPWRKNTKMRKHWADQADRIETLSGLAGLIE